MRSVACWNESREAVPRGAPPNYIYTCTLRPRLRWLKASDRRQMPFYPLPCLISHGHNPNEAALLHGPFGEDPASVPQAHGPEVSADVRKSYHRLVKLLYVLALDGQFASQEGFERFQDSRIADLQRKTCERKCVMAKENLPNPSYRWTETTSIH